MIRILQFELTESCAGIETFLYNVYSHIDREDYHFDFVTSVEHPAYEKELNALGAHIYRIASYRNPVKYRYDIEKVMGQGYDVIHINKNSAANIVPFVLAKKYTDAKVIAHSHNTRPSTGRISSLMHLVNQKKLYELSDVHLACSGAAGRWLFGGWDFTCIPNGIDVQKFRFNEDIRRQYRQELGLGESFTIINVGRFNEQKNHTRLVDIFSEVLKIRPDSRLMLVGTGALENTIKEKVRRLSLDDRVIFVGARNDVNSLLMAADCFVMPSLYEGLPIALIEAQAAGLPILLSDSASHEAGITDRCQYFSLSDSDVKIAQTIASAEGSDEIMRKEDNDKVMASEYNIDNTVERLSEIYDISRDGNL